VKLRLLASALVLAPLVARGASPQVPALPTGAETRWIVQKPEEIVAYVVFDPATVAGELPRAFRFITLDELASNGIAWAGEHIAAHPARGRWAASFLEIVRADTFTIDGRSPRWPAHGAVALWCARVASTAPDSELGPGRPLLVLQFWMPDPAYADYMRTKGHHATYGEVALDRAPDGTWRGSITADGLNATAQCTPAGPVTGGAGSAGMQAFFPPASSTVRDVVRVAFAGHRVQDCRADAAWTLAGRHPLAIAAVLSPSNFEFGYDLVGGAYRQ